jgi:hypothetical protein
VPQNRSERRAKQHVVEKVTATIAPQETNGDRYRIRIISAGDGSSATYPADVLERDAAAAWPIGTRMRANHDGWMDWGGDVTRLMAKTISTPEWDAEEQASFAEIQVGEAWSGWFRDFADVIGVSISASCEVAWPEPPEDGTEYENDLLPIVTRILPMSEAPYNSIDVVEAPGANGRIVAALEAMRDLAHEHFGIKETSRLDAEIRERRGTPEAPVTEGGIQMDKDELTALLAEHKKDVLAGVVEAVRPVEPSEKPTLKATTEAIVAAGLSEDGRDAVYEAVEAGKPLADAIEREKGRETRMAERIRTQVEAERGNDIQGGIVHEAGTHTENLDDVDGALKLLEGAR